jgi:hypothetical protein
VTATGEQGFTQKIESVGDALDAAEPRPRPSGTPTEKKNYAERLSRALATCLANGLRSQFPGTTPDETGARQEAPARTSRGVKKLDVNYSTPELGLSLGLSIKTINFPDPTSGRYTKNYSRNDNELRAEATDYHQRQPYAVLIAVVFLPVTSCDDAANEPSSFGNAVRYFRRRSGRRVPRNDLELFERVFVGLYEYDGESRGWVRFLDVEDAPPRDRRLTDSEGISFDELISEVVATYEARNNPLASFEWAD